MNERLDTLHSILGIRSILYFLLQGSTLAQGLMQQDAVKSVAFVSSLLSVADSVRGCIQKVICTYKEKNQISGLLDRRNSTPRVGEQINGKLEEGASDITGHYAALHVNAEKDCDFRFWT